MSSDASLARAHYAELLREEKARWRALREWLEGERERMLNEDTMWDTMPARSALREVLAKMRELEREQGGGE